MNNRHAMNDLSGEDTAPGVRLIKNLWKIRTEKTPPEKAPVEVAHDIYQMPSRSQNIPRRHRGVAER